MVLEVDEDFELCLTSRSLMVVSDILSHSMVSNGIQALQEHV